MKSEKISTFKKRFRREWLLIAVDKMDEATTTPLRGRLLAHSPHREDVYSRLKARPKKFKSLLVQYSEDDFPQGHAAAF